MSTIPPGQTDLALHLAQLPQPSEYDCSVELDTLTMAGLNAVAIARATTVDEIAKEAIYVWLRLFFAEQDGKSANLSQEPP